MSFDSEIAAETSAQLSNVTEWAEDFEIQIAGFTGVFSVTGFFDKSYLQTDANTGAAIQSNSPRAILNKTDVETICGQAFPLDGSQDWIIERIKTGIQYFLAKVTVKDEYILLVDLVKTNAA